MEPYAFPPIAIFGKGEGETKGLPMQKNHPDCSRVAQNSIRDARTPQPGEIVFNTMRNRSSETEQSSGSFQSSVRYIKLQLMFK